MQPCKTGDHPYSDASPNGEWSLPHPNILSTCPIIVTGIEALGSKIRYKNKCIVWNFVLSKNTFSSKRNLTTEMSNWIGPTVKQLWNYAMHVLHNFFRFNINTAAFCLGRSSLHLLLLKSSMHRHLAQCWPNSTYKESGETQQRLGVYCLVNDHHRIIHLYQK